MIVSKKNLVLRTKKKLAQNILDDLHFGFIVSKFVNSNAIVLIKDFATVGIGCGQTNRLDSSNLKIKQMKKNLKNTKAVLASDGFFPFPDIVRLCAKNNIYAIIQPGGSVNDDLVIKTAEKFKNSNYIYCCKTF